MSLKEASLHVACMSARYVCASVQGEGASLQINFPLPSSLSPPPSLTLLLSPPLFPLSSPLSRLVLYGIHIDNLNKLSSLQYKYET